jgi:hypothetical protein
MAKALWPEVKPMIKREVASEIALRARIQEALGPRRRRQRRAASKASEPAKESEIEIPFDF